MMRMMFSEKVCNILLLLKYVTKDACWPHVELKRLLKSATNDARRESIQESLNALDKKNNLDEEDKTQQYSASVYNKVCALLYCLTCSVCSRRTLFYRFNPYKRTFLCLVM